MATLPELPIYTEEIYQLALDDPDQAGDVVYQLDGVTPLTGFLNAQASQIANRTAYLREKITQAEDEIGELKRFDDALGLRNDITGGAYLVGFQGDSVAAALIAQDGVIQDLSDDVGGYTDAIQNLETFDAELRSTEIDKGGSLVAYHVGGSVSEAIDYLMLPDQELFVFDDVDASQTVTLPAVPALKFDYIINNQTSRKDHIINTNGKKFRGQNLSPASTLVLDYANTLVTLRFINEIYGYQIL